MNELSLTERILFSVFLSSISKLIEKTSTDFFAIKSGLFFNDLYHHDTRIFFFCYQKLNMSFWYCLVFTRGETYQLMS